jgi:hypothetical protein
VSKLDPFDPEKLRLDPPKLKTPGDEDGLVKVVQPDGEIIMAKKVDWRAERDRLLAAGFDPKLLGIGGAKPVKGRQKQFILLPWNWFEALKGADGQTYRLALYLQYMHWKAKGGPIKLANGALAATGVPRHAKYRALGDLEQRGLITVDRVGRKSPIIRVVE